MNDKIKVLILDDDPDDAFLVRDTLDEDLSQRYSVEAVLQSDHAVARLARGGIDILICDHMLGAEKGTDFISALPGMGFDLPCILLTGIADNLADELALEAGAADFVSKLGLSFTVLDRTIRYAIANGRRQRLLNSVFNTVNAAICVDDGAGQPATWNAKFSQLAEDYLPDEPPTQQLRALLTAARAGDLDSRLGDIRLDVHRSELSDGRFMVTMHDVSEHVQALEERHEAMVRADHMARHCALTGLPNRIALQETLEQRFDLATRSGKSFSFFLLDVDRFKSINDIHGHVVGDRLLMEVAERLRTTCEADDFVARMGGDEFVIIGQEEDDHHGEPLSKRLSAAFGMPFDTTGRPLSISVGVAQCPQHGSAMHDLVSCADMAMYRSKTSNETFAVRFDETIDREERDKRQLTNDLTDAVEREALDVHYQPQVDAATGKVRGFEALVRWDHPRMGAVSPNRFIPLAENNGLIDRLGLMVLRRACRDAGNWPDHCGIAVNVSAIQLLNPSFIQNVRSVLVESGLAPRRLELEITESTLMEDHTHIVHVLRMLKDMGIQLAIDDFGTGYSSLTTLAAFPFDRLKIDRSFVNGLGRDPRLETVVRACVGLGRNLNLDTIAEGVETNEQVAILRDLGCSQFQGYLFAKPMPLKQTIGYLESMINGKSSMDTGRETSPTTMARQAAVA